MADIFISWSKERSLQFAKALRELMAQVLRDPEAKPRPEPPGRFLVTLSDDLPKGGNWFQHLAGLLEHSGAGIICVTPENRSSPWLLFEAGALIRCDYDVALFPVLLDLAPQAIEGPLSLLQATVIERDPARIRQSTFELLQRVSDHVNTLRRAHKRQPIELAPLPPELPAGTRPTRQDPWSLFATTVLQIQAPSLTSVFDRFPQLFERKTFQEPFQDCADQRWLDRYAGARMARDEMERQTATIRTALPSGAQLAYARLSGAVDSYAMAIAGLLLDERAFARGVDGSLDDADGRLAVCERRRKAILESYLRLRDPIPPVFDDARLYEELSDLKERKIRLIHPLEHRLDAPPSDGSAPVIQDWQLARAATSPWLYDRLVYYIHSARATDAHTLAGLMDGLDRELGLLEARDEPTTLVGLYYALQGIERRGVAYVGTARLKPILDRISSKIEELNQPREDGTSGPAVDASRKVRRMVQRLRDALQMKARPTGQRRRTAAGRRGGRKN